MKIEVVSRSNTGIDSLASAIDQTEAAKLAKALRTPLNHMVCIDVDDVRVNRWDRDRVEGENCWKKTNPEEMETLGPIRLIKRA